jgi:RNA polymerase sigma factor (sigma-70 family)
MILTDSTIDLQHTLEAERRRIVRLCAYLTGDPDAAEDIAQEVMIAAWRGIDRLRDPEALHGWLSGIARNMSLRWLRQHGRSIAHTQPIEAADPALLAEPFDWETELHRHELVTLLDRALALLPAETRDVLIAKYVAESPHAAIARQLGLSENAITVRLHRGRLALKRLLVTDLRDEAQTFGLLGSDDEWQPTRIWCVGCGDHRLLGRFGDDFALRCPRCSIEPDAFHSQTGLSILGGVTGFKPALNRFAIWMHDYFGHALAHGFVACKGCGRRTPLRMGMPPHAPPSVRRQRGIHTLCDRCNSSSYESLHGLALDLPQGRRFFRDHPRIVALPEVEVEADGRPALVVRFREVNGGAAYNVLVDRDSYRVLTVGGDDV